MDIHMEIDLKRLITEPELIIENLFADKPQKREKNMSICL